MTNNEYTQKLKAALDADDSVNFGLHREVCENVLNKLARLNDNMFGIFKTPNKAKGNFIISQLRDYESQLKEAAQIKINSYTAFITDECEDNAAVQESIDELQAFIQMLDDKTFNVGKFTTQGKIAEAIAAVNINADVIEKVWKCRRFQRNAIIAALVAAAAAGIVCACVKNSKTKSVLVIDDCGTLNMDFSDQGIAEGLALSAELINDNDELLDNVAI
jgi:hypothetical protein